MIENRYDFMIIFDAKNSNPNGDPDANNSPRINPINNHGIVTDVCLKRKIRNYIEITRNSEEGMEIIVKENAILNDKYAEIYDDLNIKKAISKNSSEMEKVIEYACKKYYDIRMFGQVMNTGDKPCGIVRGPVQLGISESIDPIYVNDLTITRVATTDGKKEGCMGRKSIVPYAVYVCKGYINAAYANRSTDITEEDVETLWEAISNMFENDRSSARGEMNVRKLIIFKHNNAIGNCKSDELFDLVSITNKTDDIPNDYDDYDIQIDTNNVPTGIKIIEK